MEQWKRKILSEGKILSEQVLNLDTLLNQQVDTDLIMKTGQEFARRFRDARVSKVLTIESSGISVAFATAHALQVPLIFARRKKTLLSDQEAYCERVPSFTKGIVTDIVINKQFLAETDRILLVDDIIANGDAARGMIRIISRSGAELVGLGIVVEKAFQAGARTIREQGLRVESLVKIVSLANDRIELE